MSYRGFSYQAPDALCSTVYIWETVRKIIGSPGPDTRILDVGCGNGAMAGRLASSGCKVVGVDLSHSGIEIARNTYPNLRFEELAADELLLDKLAEKPFDYVISTEVVEHLFDPKSFARGCFSALKPGGWFLCSTPYHGYIKNLAIALTNHFDRHVSPLWDGGHIKFWSRATLTELLQSAGFVEVRFAGAGRMPYIWKSMVMSGQKPLKINGTGK
jgi:2-polyprenyl-6-hydroxyphenyl methylase/3-demethylubiquinone-9 3-methyltransferase